MNLCRCQLAPLQLHRDRGGGSVLMFLVVVESSVVVDPISVVESLVVVDPISWTPFRRDLHCHEIVQDLGSDLHCHEVWDMGHLGGRPFLGTYCVVPGTCRDLGLHLHCHEVVYAGGSCFLLVLGVSILICVWRAVETRLVSELLGVDGRRLGDFEICNDSVGGMGNGGICDDRGRLDHHHGRFPDWGTRIGLNATPH